MLRKANIWYSARDGNFNDPTTWLSNGRKKYSYPQSGDTVYVNHTVTVNMTTNVKNVYVAGTLKFSNSTLTINGDLQVTGTLDHTGINSYLNLKGVNNAVNVFLPGPTSTIEYSRLGDQDIMDLSYFNLSISGGGNKYIYGELTINGVTNINGNGGGAPTLFKVTNSGRLTFVGMLTSVGISTPGYINNLINADLEFQAGINIDYRGLNLNLGTGNLYFNGASIQLMLGGGSNTLGYNNFNTILIKGSSIVTIVSTSNTPLILNGSINGETANSTLRISGSFYQGNTTEPMLTGIFLYNYGGTSTISYVCNGDFTIPYTEYNGLHIRGTGLKILSGDTTIGSLSTFGGTLDLSYRDFTVNGPYSQSGLGGGVVKNNANGITIFGGAYLAIGSNLIFQFSLPCIVEFRNGIDADIRGFTSFAIVSGSTIKFTTNNQSIKCGGGSVMLGADILVSGPITVSVLSSLSYGNSGTLNGDHPKSIFSIQPGGLTNSFTYKNAQQPMQLGILDCNSAPNTFIYANSGAQDITPGIYRNLSLTGSGSKNLLGNVSVVDTYSLVTPATLNTNGFLLNN
ncbi:hypothetical protein A0256_22130 [Mucilaginibacter sp. PAMC 26640]|nr:hypothetical protein A0256_22130 [Mucilaginibacter sp. PAMC 26640]